MDIVPNKFHKNCRAMTGHPLSQKKKICRLLITSVLFFVQEVQLNRNIHNKEHVNKFNFFEGFSCHCASLCTIKRSCLFFNAETLYVKITLRTLYLKLGL